MTPPPCLLRKLRQEGTAERQWREKYPREDPLDWSSAEGRESCRSSRSSLSTLTGDHVAPPNITQPTRGGEEQSIIRQSNPFHHQALPRQTETKPYETYASLKRKFQTSNTRLSSPQISNRIENGCCNRRLPQSVTSSPVPNGRCQHTLERTIEMFKRDSLAIGNGGPKQGQTTEMKAAENEVSSLSSTVEMLRDKVNRLMAPLSTATKQISTAIKVHAFLKVSVK